MALQFFGRKQERGSILILTLVISFSLIVLSAGMLNMLVSESSHTTRSITSMSALNVAEAGVDHAIWEMVYNGETFAGTNGWSGTNPATKTVTFQTSSGDAVGEYVTTVTNPGTNSVIVETTGYVPSQSTPKAQRTVQVGLTGVASPSFSHGAYGVDSLTLGDSARVDSFDSTVAAYDSNNPGSNGDVGTSSIDSSAITLGSGSYVDGDGAVGVSGDPDVVMPYDSSYYSGTKAAQTTAFSPPAAVPGSYTDQGTLDLDGTTTVSASGKYSSITLEKDSVLTFDQDVDIHITGALSFAKDSRIDITNGASVRIYMDGGLTWNKDGQFNNVSQDPTKLIIYGTSNYTDSSVAPDETVGGIQIKKDTVFYGAIYAPNATITIKKDSQIYGAVVGKKVTIDQNTKIHFDEALLTTGSGNSTYTVSYWQEK